MSLNAFRRFALQRRIFLPDLRRLCGLRPKRLEQLVTDLLELFAPEAWRLISWQSLYYRDHYSKTELVKFRRGGIFSRGL